MFFFNSEAMLEGAVALSACNTSCKIDRNIKCSAKINTELSVRGGGKSRNGFPVPPPHPPPDNIGTQAAAVPYVGIIYLSA